MPLINNVNEMDERISFQKKKTIQDENGDMITTLVEVGSCWCKVKKQLLKEYQASVGTVLEDTVTFIIRSFQSFEINHTMTIKYKKQDYEIVQSMPDATSKEFFIYIGKLKK